MSKRRLVSHSEGNMPSIDKWMKFQVLKAAKKLEPFLPATIIFSEQGLWNFIRKYGTVVLKPNRGHSGKGVIHLFRLEEDRYAIQMENRKIILDGKEATFGQIGEIIHSRKYMIQRRIVLAEIDTQPFDLRIMVQRNKSHSPWRVTGMMAKVAEKGYLITNVCTKVLPVKQAIELSYVRPASTHSLIQKIKKVSLWAAKQLGSTYPRQNRIGLDIGVDAEGNVWIIEANFHPCMRSYRLMKRAMCPPH